MANLPDFSSKGTLVSSSPSPNLPDFSGQGTLVSTPSAPSAPKPSPGVASGLEKGAYLGAMSDWDRAAEALARGAGDIAHKFGDQQWMPGSSLTAKDLAAEEAFRNEYKNQSGFGAGSLAGQILGTVPTAAIGGEIPGALGVGARLLGAAGAGAETGEAGTKGATKGAELGVGTSGLGSAAGRLIKKWVQPEAERLMAEGVKLTPGQMKGGAASSLEEKLSGTMPITGYTIKRAREQSIHDWNTATLNRALAPIGEKITGAAKSGYEAVAEAGDKLSAAYDRVLNNPNLKFVITPKYAQDTQDIERESTTLPSQQRDQFKEIVNYSLNDPKILGLPTGQQIKTALSTFGTYARRYAGSSLPGERQMAGLLRDYQTAIKENLSRTNPDQAKFLNKIDNGWAQLVRIEHAARSRIASDGVFMPSDLLKAERAAGNSVRKRAFSRGEGMVQSWARDAEKILPSKTPDSGTAGRMILESGLGTAAGILGGAEAPHYAIPAVVGTMASSLPYTKPGMSIMNWLGKPGVRNLISNIASKTGQFSASPVSSMFNQNNMFTENNK